MIKSLKTWPLLKGYRGKPAVDIERLIEVIMRFSYLVADYAEIKEIDVNPLLVMPDEIIGLDARVVVERDRVVHARPYSHLAISPYPRAIRHDEEAQGRHRSHAPADPPRGRADVAPPARDLLARIVAIPL